MTADTRAIVRELATLITQAINLDVPPDQIDPDAPLYGEGLGLDSIDILEVALVVAKRYNLQLKADSKENHLIFASLRSLAQYVAAHSPSVGSPQM
jgi:acyl carrier protein